VVVYALKRGEFTAPPAAAEKGQGSWEYCLKWKEEIRPDYLIVRLRQPGGPLHHKALEAIRVFGDSVIPEL
jgi:hypothetical protein